MIFTGPDSGYKIINVALRVFYLNFIDIETSRQEEVPLWRFECWTTRDSTSRYCERQRKNVETTKNN